MNPSSTTATGTNPKPPKAGKDGKEGKDGKAKDAKKARDASSGAATTGHKDAVPPPAPSIDLGAMARMVERLAAEVAALRESVTTADIEPIVRREAAEGSRQRRSRSDRAEALLTALSGDPGAVVAIAYPAADGAPPHATVADVDALHGVDTARIARIGYAFASVPKVSLLRQLLAERERTAAQLGEAAGLTTGSLYHHLRELVHAEVVETTGRNQYALTSLGRRVTMALFALSGDAGQR